MTIRLTSCAGCGKEESAYVGLSDLASEFCGKCNQRYYEDLDYISPESVAEGMRLQRAATLYHVESGYGELDELCCAKCCEFSRWLKGVKNFMGSVPSKLLEPEPLWVRVAREVVRDYSQRKVTAAVAGRLEELKSNVAAYERSVR